LEALLAGLTGTDHADGQRFGACRLFHYRRGRRGTRSGRAGCGTWSRRRDRLLVAKLTEHIAGVGAGGGDRVGVAIAAQHKLQLPLLLCDGQLLRLVRCDFEGYGGGLDGASVVAALHLRAHTEHAHVGHEELGHSVCTAAVFTERYEYVHTRVGLDEPGDPGNFVDAYGCG